jgi:hypothetical protein
MDDDAGGRDVDHAEIATLRDAVDADSIDELVERLDSDDPDERAGAAWQLVESASKRPTKVRTHLDAVVDSIEDDDLWVRRGATWTIAELAEQEPDALAVKFSQLVDLTKSDDQLVRQNGVVAVSGVTKRYPARATRGLSAIAPLTQSDDPLMARYAKQAVQDVAEAIAKRAEDAGYPMLVQAMPEYVDLFPEGVEVVSATEEEDADHAVYVSFGQDAPQERERGAGAGGSGGGQTPPSSVPDAPDVSIERDDVEPELELRETVLTTDHRATVDERVLEHGVVVYRELTGDAADVVDEFSDALRAWAAIGDHDHVQTVLGHGDDWVATQYDDGDTLDRRGPPRSLGEAVYIIQRVTRAVSSAHARGVVHGGLHPGVVRFVGTGAGAWDAPVVADWGFAHAASGVENPPIPTGFAAAEHHDPDRYGRFDQATDVFGLGALAYYLLTGEPPMLGDPVPATKHNPSLPELVNDLFDRTLSDDKTARYETVLDFQNAFDDVTAAMRGEP